MSFEKEKVPFYDFGRRLKLERDLIHAAVDSALDSGALILGSSVEAFEAELSESFGYGGAVAVANGTDALELAIRALMPEGKSKVLTAANAGGYASLAATLCGFTPMYWEIDPETLVMDLNTLNNSLEELVAAGCGVVVFTHLYGTATDLSQLRKTCDSLDIGLVEDCAQAVGGYSFSGSLGGLGHMGTFSFYPSKNLGAIGDAGAIVSQSSELLRVVRKLRQYGWSERYDIELQQGMNSRMDSIQAEYLRRKMGHVLEIAQIRRQIVVSYRDAAPDLAFVSRTEPGNVAHLAVVKTKRRNSMATFMGEHGIDTAVHYPIPDYLQIGIAQDVHLPVTAAACGSVLSLPCNEFMSDSEVSRVCDALRIWNTKVLSSDV